MRFMRVMALAYMFAATTLCSEGIAQQSGGTVTIDGEAWTLSRRAGHCLHLGPTAQAQYRAAPIYHPLRDATVNRYLVNATSDCWIEVSIAGVDDVSFIYKISQDKTVLDQRQFSNWGPSISAYPETPNGL